MVNKSIKALISVFICLAFVLTSILPPAYAQGLNLPPSGSMISLSAPYNPAIIRGITIHPENPLKFDFIVEPGDDQLHGDELKKEAEKLIKYFMASLTVPEDEMWVNLSPYEKDRIVADGLSQTEMGRDLLVQDYILKQVTASIMYPEEKLGNDFWKRVYAKAQSKFGTTEIPMNTFNKVWIIPQEANIFMNGNSVFVVDNYFKVMLEEDYLALEENLGHDKHGVGRAPENPNQEISEVSKEIIREVLLSEIEREVNEGKNFANLRQIFNSMILASWYKQNLKKGLLGNVYINKNKVDGIHLDDKQVKEKIYKQYVEAFEKGVYDYIKEDYDETTQEFIPRKYFSGGIEGNLKGKVRRSRGAQPKTKLLMSLLGAVIFGVQFNNISIAQVEEPSNLPDSVMMDSNQQGEKIVLGHQRLNNDFLLSRFKQTVVTGKPAVFTLYSRHESGADFYEIAPAIQHVVDSAKQQDQNVAIFFEKGHPDFEKLDITLIQKIWKQLTSNQPVEQDILDELRRQMESSARQFRNDYQEALLTEDSVERERKLNRIITDTSFRGYRSANDVFLRNLLLTGSVNVEVYFEKPSIEYALEHMRYVLEMAEQAGLDSQSSEAADYWSKHALRSHPQKASLRDQSKSDQLQSYVENNDKVKVISIRGLQHISVLEGYLGEKGITTLPYASAWHIREMALLGIFTTPEIRDFMGITRFAKTEVFTDTNIDTVISREAIDFDKLIKRISANKEYLEKINQSFSTETDLKKVSLRANIKATIREFLNSLVTLGLSQEDAVQAYFSSGGVSGIFFQKALSVYAPMMGPDSLLEIILSEQYRQSISEEFGMKEYYLIKNIAPDLSYYLIINGLSASTEGKSWDSLMDKIIDDLVRFENIEESERDEFRKKLDVVTRKAVSEILLLFQGPAKDTNRGNQAVLDEANANVGGIDFNPNNIDLNVDGNEIKMNVPASDFLNNSSVGGFIPVIINIAPISNIPLLLGGSVEAPRDHLSKIP